MLGEDVPVVDRSRSSSFCCSAAGVVDALASALLNAATPSGPEEVLLGKAALTLDDEEEEEEEGVGLDTPMSSPMEHLLGILGGFGLLAFRSGKEGCRCCSDREFLLGILGGPAEGDRGVPLLDAGFLVLAA